MDDNVKKVLERIKISPVIQSGKKSIVILSSSDVDLNVKDFNDAIEYIWENNLVKILKVERDHAYIIKIFADIADWF